MAKKGKESNLASTAMHLLGVKELTDVAGKIIELMNNPGIKLAASSLGLNKKFTDLNEEVVFHRALQMLQPHEREKINFFLQTLKERGKFGDIQDLQNIVTATFIFQKIGLEFLAQSSHPTSKEMSVSQNDSDRKDIKDSDYDWAVEILQHISSIIKHKTDQEVEEVCDYLKGQRLIGQNGLMNVKGAIGAFLKRQTNDLPANLRLLQSKFRSGWEKQFPQNETGGFGELARRIRSN